jgi:hypothetical protein
MRPIASTMIVQTLRSTSHPRHVRISVQGICVSQVVINTIAHFGWKSSLHLLGELKIPGFAEWNDGAIINAARS